MNAKLNKQKIFMFSSVHVWMDTRIFYKEVMTLAQNGYQVDFYAIDNGNSIPDTSIQVHLLPQKSRWHRPFRWHYLYQEALKSDALYYHFHDPELLVVAEKLRKKKPGAIIIYDMHEHFPNQIITKDWIPKILRKPLSSWIRKKEKMAMQVCDAVIFAEKSYAHNYMKYRGLKQEILNFPTWQPEYRILKAEKFTFIYVGDIVIERNVFGMIELISELKKRGYRDIQLKLIGPISISLEVKINKYTTELGIEQEVKLFGRLPYSEIWNHYRQAHIGLCLLYPQPNFLNSLATKLYEYMAVGLPSIISDFPDWRVLMIETNSGITVNPYKISEVADAAEKLINNPQLCKILSESGRAAFEQKYNWENEAKKLVQLYDHLLKVKTE
ncbi:glycosyltransferase family 4 protein [Bacillus cereus]|uniref:glycosyltransferase family 4 protein n=1 Tax=Bacillus cereus TaxID=1396 RepID=UPI0010BD5820|nr:glycosyltransferase family 4 protein [Bacillus cereus]TKI28931.1 glycosyltransferase family 4 protein [Bacillus cereus]